MPTDAPSVVTLRRRFAAALLLFLAWVGALAAMALTTARRPQAAESATVRSTAPTETVPRGPAR